MMCGPFAAACARPAAGLAPLARGRLLSYAASGAAARVRPARPARPGLAARPVSPPSSSSGSPPRSPASCPSPVWCFPASPPAGRLLGRAAAAGRPIRLRPGQRADPLRPGLLGAQHPGGAGPAAARRPRHAGLRGRHLPALSVAAVGLRRFTPASLAARRVVAAVGARRRPLVDRNAIGMVGDHPHAAPAVRPPAFMIREATEGRMNEGGDSVNRSSRVDGQAPPRLASIQTARPQSPR